MNIRDIYFVGGCVIGGVGVLLLGWWVVPTLLAGWYMTDLWNATIGKWWFR